MKIGFPAAVIGSIVVLGGLCFLLWQGGSPIRSADQPQTLHFYCAAGVRRPVQQVIDSYRDEYGVEIETTFDGSGKLLALIETGNKGDLYLAADSTYIDDGRRRGLLKEAVDLARQKPCLAVSRKSKLDSITLSDLIDGEVKVSLADPEVAAISRVARRLIRGHYADDAKLWEKILESATVIRHTVNEVANDVKAGVVDVGIVWDATAEQYDELTEVPVPAFEASGQKIMAAVLASSTAPQQTLHFLRYLSAADRGLNIFRQMGYQIVEGDVWSENPEVHLFTGGLMHPAIQSAIDEFEQREGVRVVQTPNGCGILVSQIRAGEHPDVYFACDTSFMEKVDDVFPQWEDLSGTEMVIIVRPEVDRETTVTSLEDLAKLPLKLGLCNPDHSALGALSKQLIVKQGYWSAIEPKVLDWPSTADRLVESVIIGGLDAAIVYRANTTLQADKLVVLDIPDKAAQAVQPIAVANDSQNRGLSRRLIERLQSAKSRTQFESRGFEWLVAPDDLQGTGTQGTGTQGIGTQGIGTQGIGTQGIGTQGTNGQDSRQVNP